MKKIIVVGSNSGYGQAIAKILQHKGWQVIGVSRGTGLSESVSEHIQITDVSNGDLFEKEFQQVIFKHADSEAVVFVPGYVHLKEPKDLTGADIEQMFEANVGYVLRGVKQLKENTAIKKVITFGSRFSYLENDGKLALYSIAKHLLRRCTELINQEGFQAYHYCVPTSKTAKAEKNLRYVNGVKDNEPIDRSAWAEPEIIAELIVNSFITEGDIREFRFECENNEWVMKALEPVTTKFGEELKKLGMKDVNDHKKILNIIQKYFIEIISEKGMKREVR